MTELATGTGYSVKLLDYLKSLPDGSVFDADMLVREVPGVTHGSVTGFLNRLHNANAITVHDVGRRITGSMINRYQVVDLSEIVVRVTRSKGGKVGRSNPAHKTTRAALIETLFTVVEKIEEMRMSIEDYSTDELLREIGRRTRAAEPPKDAV